MSLYKAEMRRLTKRRFTKWLVIGSLLVLAAIALVVFLTSKKVGPSQIATAQAAAQQDYERAVQQTEADKQQCEAAQGTPAASNWPPNCDQLYTPAREDFSYQNYMPPTFEFSRSSPPAASARSCIMLRMPAPRSTTMKQFDCWIIMRINPTGDDRL